jgi:hypothetical protein
MNAEITLYFIYIVIAVFALGIIGTIIDAINKRIRK